MTKVRDITNFLEGLFPLETAEGFDNPGLMVGSLDADVTSVAVCLDATKDVVRNCMELNMDLVLAHHPLIFGGISSISFDEPKGQIIRDLIRGGITCYAAHTNLDKNSEYSNNVLASAIGLTNIHEIDGIAYGVCGELESEVTLKDFCERVEEGLRSSGTIVYSLPETKVKKVFCQGGAFDEDSIPAIVSAGVDTVVSGEIKHHVMLDLIDRGITPITAGHNATERVFMSNLCGVLDEAFPEVEFVYFDGRERRF